MGFGRRGRLLVALLLTAFAAPSLLLGGLAVTGGSLPGTLTLAALAVPLVAITLALAALARAVASEPDEPALVDDRLGEAVGMTGEEYRELTEEHSRD